MQVSGIGRLRAAPAAAARRREDLPIDAAAGYGWPFWAFLVGLAVGGIVLGVVAISARRRARPLAAAVPHPPHPRAGPATERRQSARRIITPVFILFRTGPEQSEPKEGLLLNSSAGGLGLSLNEHASPGTVLHIRVAGSASAPWVAAEVTHCEPLTSRWKVGCRFLQPLPDQVRLLLG